MTSDSLRGWLGLLIVAVGGFVGTWIAYDRGAAITGYKVEQLESWKATAEVDLRAVENRVLVLEQHHKHSGE